MMKESWFTRIAYTLRLKRRALPFRPAWFEAAYLAAPEPPVPAQLRDPRAFNDQEKAAIWQKGRPILGWDPNDWRVDDSGEPIFRHHYGDPQSAFGWEVGRVVPVRGDEFANLRPRRCQATAPARFSRAFHFDHDAR
jgi:hypothetical protein